MKVQLARPTLEALDEVHSDAMCLFLFEDVRPLKGLAGLVDWRVGAHLSRLMAMGWLTGRQDERFIMPARHKLPVNKVVGFGLGPLGEFTPDRQRPAVARAFGILVEAGIHGAILTAPGRTEGVGQPMDGLEAVVSCIDPTHDFDEVVVVDRFPRMQDAYRRLDLLLKPILGIA